MKKATKLILMLCLILSGAFCFVHGETGTETEGDGITIDLIEGDENWDYPDPRCIKAPKMKNNLKFE